jgi:hypothetical protein
MRIDVTSADIALANSGTGKVCPLSIALERVTGRPWRVGTSKANDGRRRYGLGKAVQERLRRHDLAEKIAPFTVMMEVLDEALAGN